MYKRQVHGGSYYLYGTRGPTCWGKADGFDVYRGNDLENWEGPIEIFHNDGSFWSDPVSYTHLVVFLSVSSVVVKETP